MLYLIEDRDYLKIGFTTNLKTRMTSYKVENCYCQMIDNKPGSRKDEGNLHNLCEQWHYQGEWFHNVPEVKQIWNEYIPKFEEFETIKIIVADIQELIIKAKKLDDLELLRKWDRLLQIGCGQYYKTLHIYLDELENEDYIKALSDYDAFRKLHYMVRYSSYEEFNHSFDYFDIIITPTKSINKYDQSVLTVKQTINWKIFD